MNTPRAEIRNGQVYFARGVWSEVFDPSKLEGRIALYTKLAQKNPEIYQADVDALKALETEK